MNGLEHIQMFVHYVKFNWKPMSFIENKSNVMKISFCNKGQLSSESTVIVERFIGRA